MSRCLITGEDWHGPGAYSPEGLRMLDRRLERLDPLALTQQQLLDEAQLRASSAQRRQHRLRLRRRHPGLERQAIRRAHGGAHGFSEFSSGPK